MIRFALRFDARHIREYAAAYNYPGEAHIAHVVGPAAKCRGHFTRDEFLALCHWKTARSASKVRRNTASLVEEVTRIALASPHEEVRIGVLQVLRGVSWPTASVILHFAHRDPYPILDVRALWSLGITKPVACTFDLWVSYVGTCRGLAKMHRVDMRTLDRALWQYSKDNQR